MPVVKRKVLVFCMTVLFSLSCAVTALASFQRGDDGQEVVAIQKRLVELSYSINNIDGDFGPETERAVKNFQADKGLEVDGIVGSATYRALMNRRCLLTVAIPLYATYCVLLTVSSVLHMYLVELLLMVSTAPALPSMHSQEQVYICRVWLTASSTPAVRFP